MLLQAMAVLALLVLQSAQPGKTPPAPATSAGAQPQSTGTAPDPDRPFKIIAAVLGVVGLAYTIVYGIMKWKSEKQIRTEAEERTAQAARDAAEAARPRLEIRDARFFHFMGAVVGFKAVYSNQSTVAEEVIGIRLHSPNKTDWGVHLPSADGSSPRITSQTIPGWPHALPVALPPQRSTLLWVGGYVNDLGIRENDIPPGMLDRVFEFVVTTSRSGEKVIPVKMERHT